MKLKFHYRKIVLVAFFSLISFYANSQKLIESRKTSYYTYIYKLADEEAKKIYKNDKWEIDASFFHSLVDSFPTDRQYDNKLPEGHYLKTFSEKNQQKVSITTVQDFDVFILNNNTDLCVQVYDLQGNIITDAEVSVRWKKLHFDKKLQSYLDKKSNQKGLLKVTYGGFTAYYNLARQYNNSNIRRGTRKVIYGAPLKYVWMPVNFIIHLPIDGVKSIAQGWPQGTIDRTRYFFVKSFHKVACIFDNYYCGYYFNDKFERNHTGYIVFNKPKYQPGDTVKFKAFLVTRKGKPVDKPVNVILWNYRKDIELANLLPYRKGGYEYQFFLHDSLQLQLDKSYYIALTFNEEKEFIRGSFEYEDYELSKNKLSLRLDETNHYRNKEIKLYAQGTDENDLNLLDARIEVLVQPISINKYFRKQVFIPDTIFFIEKKLETTDETEVIIPDAAFPEINFEYEVVVRMLTSDNEVVSESRKINYYYELQKFDIDLIADSVLFTFRKNGVSTYKNVTITAKDNFANNTTVYEGITPCQLSLNPYYASYTIQSDSISETLDIASQASLLQCLSERTKDSVYILVDNPRQLTFSYNIYRKNTERWAGFSDSLNIQQKSATGAAAKQNYFVSIRYLWGGQVKEENYSIPFFDKKLNVSVLQPKIVYPGQKSQIEVLVTDSEKKPVEGVDVTAYSVTKKFNYSPPALPYLGKNRKDKTLINNFHFEDFDLGSHSGFDLDYDVWKLLAGLDSVEYYKFIYPENSIYRFEHQSSDSLTQFAPFVVSEGAILPVHVIYVDSKPVYFSWSTHTQPYSFKIDSGFHQIKLRTNTTHITIDSLFFTYGKKLIFSVKDNTVTEKVKIEKADAELSTYEQSLLYKYIFPYRNTFGQRFAYLQQDDEIQFLSPQSFNQLNNFAGPIAGHVSFHLLDSFTTKFFHEPFFEYEFAPELLKMRGLAANISYPKQLDLYQAEKSLSDVVLTKNSLYEQWKNYLDSKRYLTAKYKNPRSTSKGAGRLLINFARQEKSVQDVPLNILLFRYDNHEFLRVYPGSTSFIHDLEKGYYQLIFFYAGAKYQMADSINVQPDGLNYYEFEPPQVFKKDTFSIYVSDLIEETIFKPGRHFYDEEKELKQIYNVYQQQFQYTGEGNIVEGYVYEEESGEPLPGVNVIIKGTTYGTVTDIDGYYSIKVPSGSSVLNFSSVGFMHEDVPVDSKNKININLKADIQQLQEVVVVGYGVQNKSSLTASISTVTSGGIPTVSGDLLQGLEGKVAGVMISESSSGNGVEISIRGASTIEFDKTPLFIINGNVFTGDIAELDPGLIQQIEILKDASATAIYGASGANGVVIIETKAGAFKPTLAQTNKRADYDETFFEAASQASSIRGNFSDYAFWQPKLITNKDGKANFEVTFPDDVTSWETFYLAMNGKRQSGQTKNQIKSYKPLMAQLAIPRFLVQSDTAFVLGKTLNYSPDSVKVTTLFEVNNTIKANHTQYCINSLIDTLPVIAHTDSISIKYFLEKEDGYFDGELKNIPVFPSGLEEAEGNFYVLDKDTSMQLSFNNKLGEVTLYARADIIDVIEDEITHVVQYKYLCNEQIASKLKAHLAEKNIVKYKGEKFKDDGEIEKLIRLLKKNQKDNGLWGWWKNSEANEWISLHALEALTHAEKAGYATKLNKGQITETLIWELENSRDFNANIRMLKILNLLGSKINYKSYITDLERRKKLSLTSLLQIIELKQLCNLDYYTDTLKSFQKTTFFGNIYFADEPSESNLLTNDIQNTLLAYRIFKADSAINHGEILGKMRNYFLENRKTGHWRNTYESAQIIETMLPDLLQNKSELTPPTLNIQGDVNKSVTAFPFEMKISPDQPIQISKSGDFPVYLSVYQRFWNTAPKVTKGDFEIITKFDKNSSSLNAGQEISLSAEVTVKKDAEYVMVNIPIPGGCSYADKKNNFSYESHREYFKNETTIFCEYLKKGKYTFEVNIIPRYTGTYTLNPAKIELMYFPIFKANNEINQVRIK